MANVSGAVQIETRIKHEFSIPFQSVAGEQSIDVGTLLMALLSSSRYRQEPRISKCPTTRPSRDVHLVANVRRLGGFVRVRGGFAGALQLGASVIASVRAQSCHHLI